MLASLSVLLALVGLAIVLAPAARAFMVSEARRTDPAVALPSPVKRPKLRAVGIAMILAGTAGCWLTRHDDGFGNAGMFVVALGWLCGATLLVVAIGTASVARHRTKRDVLVLAAGVAASAGLILGGRWMQRMAFDPPEFGPFRPALAELVDRAGYAEATGDAYATGRVLPVDVRDGSGGTLTLAPTTWGFSWGVTKNTGGVDKHLYFALPAGRRPTSPADVDTVALLAWSREVERAYGPVGSGPDGPRWRQYRVNCRVTLLDRRARLVLAVRDVRGEPPAPAAGSKMPHVDRDEYARLPVDEVLEAVIGPTADTLRRREMIERIRQKRTR